VQAPVNMVKTIAVEKKGRDLAGTR
jgi:hypothetical protein